MKKSVFFVLLLALSVNVMFSQSEIVPLGELDPFWRCHPVLGPYHMEGIWLREIPDYFFDTDFAYKKRPYEKEVMFADHLSTVRLLGGHAVIPGFNPVKKKAGMNLDGSMKKAKFDVSDTASIRILSQLDFAYRKEDGSLGFRPELIRKKLHPYTSSGYTSFTIVLDDIPWCLTSHPEVGSFGQVAPADNPEEWYATVKELCIALKDILGEENASKLRFRIGTEMNGRERFAGSEYQFLTHFDYASAAITEVLPSCELALFNISSASMDNINNNHNVGAFRVLEHTATGINRRTGKPNIVKRPFVSCSRYYYEKDDLGQIISGIDEVWDHIEENIPGYEGMTREIHEFGALADWSARPNTQNPDAFGNAMNLQVVINLKENGLDKLFHWNMLETVRYGEKIMEVPSSHLWGFSVLDYMQGGEAYKIVPEKAGESNITPTALLSVFENKAYLLVNSFSTDRDCGDKASLSIKIPQELIPFKIRKSSSASKNNSNSIHYQIRKDFEEAGILNPLLENKKYTTTVAKMSTNASKRSKLVAEHWEEYLEMWKTSLKLEKFEGSVKTEDDMYVISLKLSAPESTVIVLEN